jgi:hypothetical protein
VRGERGARSQRTIGERVIVVHLVQLVDDVLHEAGPPIDVAVDMLLGADPVGKVPREAIPRHSLGGDGGDLLRLLLDWEVRAERAGERRLAGVPGCKASER